MSKFPIFATQRDCEGAGGRRELISCNVLAGSELRFGPGLGNGVSQAHCALNSCGQVANEYVLSCLCVPVVSLPLEHILPQTYSQMVLRLLP